MSQYFFFANKLRLQEPKLPEPANLKSQLRPFSVAKLYVKLNHSWFYYSF